MVKLFIFSLVLIFHCSLSIAQTQNFVEGFEDIPLMDGLKQITTNDIDFGNEEASYHEAVFNVSRNTDFQKISEFYLKTLPQLGWFVSQNGKNQLIFYRESAILEISKISHNPTKINIILKNKN